MFEKALKGHVARPEGDETGYANNLVNIILVGAIETAKVLRWGFLGMFDS